MNDEVRRQNGKLYSASKLHDQKWLNGKIALDELNNGGMKQMGRPNPLKEVFAEFGEGSTIIPPLYFSQGMHMHLGNHVFINVHFLVLDEADVTIGDHCFLGPNVSIYTPVHPYDAGVRASGLQIAKPVTIEPNCWIGGNVTINPGVTIGEGSIIGSGSVVTKDIPAGVIAAGNPCKVIREVTEADREYWEAEYNEYLAEEAEK